jgi:hypothetical protein
LFDLGKDMIRCHSPLLDFVKILFAEKGVHSSKIGESNVGVNVCDSSQKGCQKGICLL